MTFQVCLVGSDGFVLASDTKTAHHEGIRVTSHTPKIQIQGNLTWAVAGYDVADQASRILVEKMKLANDGNIEHLLESSGREAWERFSKDKPTERGTLTVAQAAPVRLWMLDVDSASRCTPVGDKVFAGDDRNSAVYFPEFYYKPNTKTTDLVFLAALTVLAAGHLNPTFVDGLEIAVGRNGKIEKLPKTEIARLENRSLAFHADVGDRLFHADNNSPIVQA